MKDPKKLREQRPDYVRDPNATDDPDRLPVIGGDPEDPGTDDHPQVPPPEEGESRRRDET